MGVQQVDDAGNLWFLSADDSHKNAGIALDPSVKLYFQGSPHSDFLQLNDHATISRDKEKIKELWEFIVKTWFTEEVDDPRITVIKGVPSEVYHWDTKHSNAMAGIKMLICAARTDAGRFHRRPTAGLTALPAACCAALCAYRFSAG